MQLLPGSAYSHCHRWRSKCSLTDKNNNELIERKIYQRMLKNVTMETTNVQLPARSNIRQSTYAKLIFHMFTDKSFPPTVNRYLPSLLHMISETYSRQKANKITLSINRIAINFPHKGKKGDFTASLAVQDGTNKEVTYLEFYSRQKANKITLSRYSLFLFKYSFCFIIIRLLLIEISSLFNRMTNELIIQLNSY